MLSVELSKKVGIISCHESKLLFIIIENKREFLLFEWQMLLLHFFCEAIYQSLSQLGTKNPSLVFVLTHSFRNHSGPKTPKSKPWGESPNFIWQMKEGYIRISRSKISFKSVEGNFWQISEKNWTGFPRALPPGISMRQEYKNCQNGISSLQYCFNVCVFLKNDILSSKITILLDYFELYSNETHWLICFS